jgi:hypothetical protein
MASREELFSQILDIARPIPAYLSKAEQEREERERLAYAKQCGWDKMDTTVFERELEQVGRNR